jgi:hypothetical protein
MFSTYERNCHVNENSEAIVCARRCRPSWLIGWWIQKNNRKKWRAKEEKRHKGSLTLKKVSLNYSNWQLQCINNTQDSNIVLVTNTSHTGAAFEPAISCSECRAANHYITVVAFKYVFEHKFQAPRTLFSNMSSLPWNDPCPIHRGERSAFLPPPRQTQGLTDSFCRDQLHSWRPTSTPGAHFYPRDQSSSPRVNLTQSKQTDP